MTRGVTTGFRTIVLDVDSTLCGIEGIDWLAARRGKAIAEQVAEQTDRAMRGELPLERVYAARLAAVMPGVADVEELSRAYLESVAPGARSTISKWREAGVRAVLVSGGIRNAILPLAAHLGVDDSEVHAVDIVHDASGDYADFDRSSPLSVATGKRDTVAALNLERPVLAVGDGSTDLVMREVVDCFVAFTGFATRTAVVDQADYVAASFDELSDIVSRFALPVTSGESPVTRNL